MKQIMTKLNGNAPGVTLLISLIASVGMGAGWVYQLRANAADIDDIQKEYVRKEVADAQYKALQASVEELRRSIGDLQKYLLEAKDK